MLLLAWPPRGLERMTARKAGGMAIALAGVAVLKAFEPASGSAGASATWLGDFFVFLAALCFALFTVFGKEVTHQYSNLTVNAFAYVGGGLALLPVTLWEAGRQSLAHISMGAWLAAVYMALFSSVIAYLIYYHALTHMAASRVSAFSLSAAGVCFRDGVSPSWMSAWALPVIAGGLVILSGVYLTERG